MVRKIPTVCHRRRKKFMAITRVNILIMKLMRNDDNREKEEEMESCEDDVTMTTRRRKTIKLQYDRRAIKIALRKQWWNRFF